MTLFILSDCDVLSLYWPWVMSVLFNCCSDLCSAVIRSPYSLPGLMIKTVLQTNLSLTDKTKMEYLETQCVLPFTSSQANIC